MIGAGAIAALALSVVVGTTYVHWVTIPATQKETRALVQSEARDRAIALIQQKAKDHVQISTFDLEHFCTEFGGKWVSNDCVD